MRYTLEEYKKIIEYLVNTDMTMVEIAKELNKAVTQIKRINDGGVKLAKMLFPEVEFPIRDTKMQRNIKLLKDVASNNYSIEEIAAKYKLTVANVRNILHRHKQLLEEVKNNDK